MKGGRPIRQDRVAGVFLGLGLVELVGMLPAEITLADLARLPPVSVPVGPGRTTSAALPAIHPFTPHGHLRCSHVEDSFRYPQNRPAPSSAGGAVACQGRGPQGKPSPSIRPVTPPCH